MRSTTRSARLPRWRILQLRLAVNPVTLVASPNGLNLYVVNHDDSTVGEYAIGTDGKIYLQNTYNVTGSAPTAIAIDAAGAFLYVTFTYQVGPNGQQLYSPASPGPGGVTIFPITSGGSLGTPSTVKVGNTPIGVVVSRPECPATGSYNSANATCTLMSHGTGSRPPNYLRVCGGPRGLAQGDGAWLLAEHVDSGALTPTPGTVITTDPHGQDGGDGLWRGDDTKRDCGRSFVAIRVHHG